VSYETLWAELETAGGDGAGHLVRRIHPESVTNLFLAVAKPDNRRKLQLNVDAAAADALHDVPTGRGIETRLHDIQDGARTQVELVLMDPSSADIFGALVEDVAGAVAPSEDDRAAVSAWVARLRRWQRLLATLSPDGLSAERQRGLYAELWLLRHRFVAQLGAEATVNAWTGPDAASHDFEFSRGAVEVKSTAGKRHQVLRMASERQLDDTGVDALFLFHLSLDVRQGEGETLVQAVGAARSQLEGTPAAATLEERLLAAGYSGAHEPRYRRTAYTPREQSFFHVTDDFPRLTEADLPPGVGDVRYSVAVSEAAHWTVPAETVMATLSGRSV